METLFYVLLLCIFFAGFFVFLFKKGKRDLNKTYDNVDEIQTRRRKSFFTLFARRRTDKGGDNR
jgi:hypothetical protein